MVLPCLALPCPVLSHVMLAAAQVVVTLLDPLQEGGPVAAAAVAVLEQLVVHLRHLLGDRLKTLPPLPQAVEGLGKQCHSAMFDNRMSAWKAWVSKVALLHLTPECLH